MKSADVLIEASTGKRLERKGLSDSELWKSNPKLVIAHISGFGQTGDPAYVRRASYDPIAQAFGCTMRMNGIPGHPSLPAMVFPGDYSAAFYAFSMTLAALLKRQETGIGESIDVAQFEALIRLQANYPYDYWRFGRDYVKEGPHSLICALYGTYAASDGKELYVLFLGPGVLRVGLPLIGLEYGNDLFPEGSGLIPYGTKSADVAEEAFARFLSQHTAEEAELVLSEGGVPCSTLMDYEKARTDPHYLARGVIDCWSATDKDGTKLPGVKIVPEIANHTVRYASMFGICLSSVRLKSMMLNSKKCAACTRSTLTSSKLCFWRVRTLLEEARAMEF